MESCKEARLLQLVEMRKRDRWEGYGVLADYQSGRHECDYVSPYSKSAHDPDARIFILLQDWVSSDGLQGDAADEDVVALGHYPALATNQNLKRLLSRQLGVELSQTYATNLFPFVKRGGMSAAIPLRDLVRAAREYALPQIEIVQPQLVIVLGKAAYNGLRAAAGLDLVHRLGDAIASPFQYGSSTVWCQAHTGWGARHRGSQEQVEADWEWMAARFKQG